jgi:hypothetical protein
MICESESFHGAPSLIYQYIGCHGSAWPWAVASLALSALGMAVTCVRSSLLILGEEGLSEAAERGNEAAARIRDATLDPSLRFPFSMWPAPPS